jgi:hypothetical protein
MSRREALFWLVFQLAAAATGVLFGMWLFDVVAT